MDPKARIEIGNAVKAARQERNWLQSNVADASGISQSAVAKIELGQSVRRRTLEPVLAAVGLRLRENIGVELADGSQIPRHDLVRDVLQLPPELDGLLRSLVRVLPHLPRRIRDHIEADIEYWEEEYMARTVSAADTGRSAG